MSKTPIRKCADCGSTSHLRELKSGLILCEKCIQTRVEERDKALDESFRINLSKALVSNHQSVAPPLPWNSSSV